MKRFVWLVWFVCACGAAPVPSPPPSPSVLGTKACGAFQLMFVDPGGSPVKGVTVMASGTIAAHKQIEQSDDRGIVRFADASWVRDMYGWFATLFAIPYPPVDCTKPLRMTMHGDPQRDEEKTSTRSR